MRIIHPVITFLLVSPAYLWTTKLELARGSSFNDTRHIIFHYLKTGFVNLPRLESYITCSNSIAKLYFLLACVDDIETNPGPENLPCSINQPTLNSPSDYDICWTSNAYNFCSSCLITLHYSFGLLCDTCNVWFQGSWPLGSLN